MPGGKSGSRRWGKRRRRERILGRRRGRIWRQGRGRRERTLEKRRWSRSCYIHMRVKIRGLGEREGAAAGEDPGWGTGGR